MKYPLIAGHRDAYPARWMCSALSVSERGWRSWRSRGRSKRRQQDQRLLIGIRLSFENSERTYGSPRILKDLREEGARTSKKRVARIMRENGIVAVQRRRFKVTTQSGHNLPVHQNLLDRDFVVDEPNRVWLGDITYIRTEEGWLYFAALMDLCSRRIVGWNAADRIDRWLPLTALRQALRERKPAPGLIHHTDQGGQYGSLRVPALPAGGSGSAEHESTRRLLGQRPDGELLQHAQRRACASTALLEERRGDRGHRGLPPALQPRQAPFSAWRTKPSPFRD